MQTRRQGIVLVVMASVLAVTSGCGGGTPSVSSSSTKVKVKGAVTLKGKPLTAGKISFDPANINRRDAPMATFDIAKDGTFSGETLTGENSVSVTNAAIQKSTSLSANRKMVTLDSDDNTVNIDL